MCAVQSSRASPSAPVSSCKEFSQEAYKKNVINYWERHLRAEASDPRYSSLVFFNPKFMSLTVSHPLWSTCGSSPTKISMATVQAHMVSSRYKCESLCKHWSKKNTEGFCLLSPSCANIVEDVPHILSSCSGLSEQRRKLASFTSRYAASVPVIMDLILTLCLPSNPSFVQFLLDCSCLPEVIHATQQHGKEVLEHLFLITRLWVYTLHRERMKLLGRWNYF